MHLAKVSRIAERKTFLAVLLLLWFYSISEIEAAISCFTYPWQCTGCRISGATSFNYCTTKIKTTKDNTQYKEVSYTAQVTCDVTCCSGYSAQSNECRDTDECSVSKPCDHSCANTEGSYTCSCNTGYQLSGLTSCIDTDECALNTDGCDVNSECENTAGSFRCNCNNGYQAELSTTSSTTTCVDVDECASSDTNQCDHMCHNNVGSYTCSCNTGYNIMLSGSHNCVDVNECTSTTFPHDCQHSCVNNVGSFSCTCLTGYELSGRTQCNDIDECSVSKPCDHSCANTEGSYTCSCNTGYQLSGLTSCIDIDECFESPFPCDQNCHNNVGNFTCTCRPGYNLIQGSICQDIDECATNNRGCSHFCSNQGGSYQCSCDTGYVLATDHHMCEVCIPLLCGCGCAVRIWGACVIPCLRWDNCCFRIPNPICLLYNIACFVIRIPVELALLALQGVLTFFELALYFAELALRAVQLLVEVAQLALEFAINTLEVIKQLFKFALQALEAITRFLLTGLIDIRAMGFDVKLGLLSHGHVRAWVDVSFLRASPERLTITLPIFSQLALVADFAERCIPGIGRKKRAIRSLDKVKWLANNFTKTGSIYPRLSTR